MTAGDFLAGASLEPGAEDMLFLALARLINILPVAQRLQLLEIVRDSLDPIQTEAAAAAPCTRGVSPAHPTGTRARWVALPRLRHSARSASSPPPLAWPARR